MLDGIEPVPAGPPRGAPCLTAGTVYSFRVQPLIATGEENWSQVVSLLVK
jgi:hypothetical protein